MGVDGKRHGYMYLKCIETDSGSLLVMECFGLIFKLK